MKLLPQRQATQRVFRIPLKLHPAQATVDASSARFKILRAGRKFGKTKYGQKKTLDWLGAPNSVVWYIGPTYKQTKLIVWNEFKRLIPTEALARKPNETDLIFTLKNGSEAYLMGGDEPDSIRGPAPTAVILEEAAFHKGHIWAEVIRPALTVHRAPALFISTPKGFNWFKDLEDDAKIRIRNGDPEWAVFHYTVYDNPYIAREEIEAARKDCDSDLVWRQEYMAEFESSVGRVFNSFSDDRHVGKVFLPNRGVRTARSIDWGQRDDTACLWGYVADRKLYVYREHLENNLPPASQAQIILGKTSDRETVSDSIIGHDAARTDPAMQGLTVEWQFMNAGVRPIRHSSKDKKASRALLNQLFQQDRIKIDAEHCPKLRKQLLAYEWKDTLMEKTEDGNDDAVDALHYLAEFFQYDLFIDAPEVKDQPMSEIFAQIAQEKLDRLRQGPRLELPTRSLHDEGYKVDNTVAGYPL